MTELRVQRKPERRPFPVAAAIPMGAALAVGLLGTWVLSSGRQAPAEMVPVRLPAAEKAPRGPLVIGPRTWVLADHPPVTDFAQAELVSLGAADGFPLFANRKRGLDGLGAKPGPYDRLYIELAPGRYGALRWQRAQ